MANQALLPTFISGQWSVTAFRDSLLSVLEADESPSKLIMYFYAVTNSGWDQIRNTVIRWKRAAKGRRVVLIVGTDHAITDPVAVRRMDHDGIDVRLMRRYQGVFHPKVVWLQRTKDQVVWVGSNNLTRDGLLNNIEFAVLVRSSTTHSALKQWARSVESGSEPLTEVLLRSYELQRNEFEARRAKGGATTFTWTQKAEPNARQRRSAPASGSLIVEVMPRETGADGKQLQLPVAAASSFFGLHAVGSTKRVKLRPSHAAQSRTLTMTVFSNNTVRLSILDLDYRDRPCVIVFTKAARRVIEYEIVPESIFPKRYSELLARCDRRTRAGSRRWGMA